MKKDIITCDICGTIISGPNSGPYTAHSVRENVTGAVPYLNKNRQFVSLDVCHDDWPEEYFDGDEIQLLFGGSIHQGEMLDVSQRNVLAVIIKNNREPFVRACPPDELDPDQRQFVRSATESMKQIQQNQLNSGPLNDREI